jgi:hypothetical protein
MEQLPSRVQGDLRELCFLSVASRRAALDARVPCSPDSSEDEAETEAGKPGEVNLVEVSRRMASLPLLPEFEGYGLFSSVAFTNHSCTPNVKVRDILM